MSDRPDPDRSQSRATLEIIGQAGESLAIYAETILDAPPPPIFEGELPLTGRIRLRVPRAPLLVVAGGHGRQSVAFDDDESFKAVDVSPRR